MEKHLNDFVAIAGTGDIPGKFRYETEEELSLHFRPCWGHCWEKGAVCCSEEPWWKELKEEFDRMGGGKPFFLENLLDDDYYTTNESFEAAKNEVADFCVRLDQKIVQSFFQWEKVELPEGLVASMEWQMALFKATVGSDIAKQFPVEREYCLRFCKNIIQYCKDTGEEVFGKFYDTIGEIVSGVPSSDYYKTYYLSSDLPVSVRESRALISDGTTGLTSWAAGQFLAGWLSQENKVRNMMEGKKVVELGAGSGMTGLFAVKRWKGISEYSFTDCHGEVLANMAHIIKKNCSDWTVNREDPLEIVSENGTLARVVELNWEELDLTSCTDLEADTILGADLVLDPCLLPSLVRTLSILIDRRAGCQAILVSCESGYLATWQLFLHLLGKAGLSVNTEIIEGNSTTPAYMVHVCKL